MTQEDKQLLLKDLCARLPYGVIVDYKENEFENPHWKINTIYPKALDGWIGYDKRVGTGSESGSRPFKIGEIKPYLRSMSSVSKMWGGLTEEEIENPWSLFDSPLDALNYFLENHIDFRGLIEKGLALEAPEGMYKIE